MRGVGAERTISSTNLEARLEDVLGDHRRCRPRRRTPARSPSAAGRWRSRRGRRHEVDGARAAPPSPHPELVGPIVGPAPRRAACRARARRCCGSTPRTVTSPRVIAAANAQVPATIRSPISAVLDGLQPGDAVHRQRRRARALDLGAHLLAASCRGRRSPARGRRCRSRWCPRRAPAAIRMFSVAPDAREVEPDLRAVQHLGLRRRPGRARSAMVRAQLAQARLTCMSSGREPIASAAGQRPTARRSGPRSGPSTHTDARSRRHRVVVGLALRLGRGTSIVTGPRRRPTVAAEAAAARRPSAGCRDLRAVGDRRRALGQQRRRHQLPGRVVLRARPRRRVADQPGAAASPRNARPRPRRYRSARRSAVPRRITVVPWPCTSPGSTRGPATTGTTGARRLQPRPQDRRPRIAAYADTDECNAALGVARDRSAGLAEQICAPLRQVQNDLFDVGADLCTPIVRDAGVPAAARHARRTSTRLEALVRRVQRRPAEAGLVHPAAAAHPARRCCTWPERSTRRAERSRLGAAGGRRRAHQPAARRSTSTGSRTCCSSSDSASPTPSGDVLWQPERPARRGHATRAR